jgi:tripartite-type tricarboxylate transporter receptor subunit TctC
MSVTVSRRSAILSALAVAASPALPTAAAETYPARPVKLIVPFTAGGITDIVARLFAQRLSEDLNQRFYVDNRPGAGGNLALEIAAKSPPDGYTLGVATAGTHAINPSIYPKMPYDHIKDFVPVTLLSYEPSFLIVNPALPVHSVAELVALLKAKPNTYNYGSAGYGSSSHMSAEYFKIKTGTTMTHVPYKGGPEVVQAVMTGQVEVAVNGVSTSLRPVRDGMVRALAITSRERSPLMPELPALAETLPGFEALAWNGLVAPAGTPPEVVETLVRAVRKAVKDPKIAERFQQMDGTAVGSTSAEFAAFIAAETKKWAEVAKISGARVE